MEVDLMTGSANGIASEYGLIPTLTPGDLPTARDKWKNIKRSYKRSRSLNSELFILLNHSMKVEL